MVSVLALKYLPHALGSLHRHRRSEPRFFEFRHLADDAYGTCSAVAPPLGADPFLRAVFVAEDPCALEEFEAVAVRLAWPCGFPKHGNNYITY